MIFSWLRRRRRKKILSQPFPEEWEWFLQKNVGHYRQLSEDEAARLRQAVQIFVAEKDWEGCGGLEMTDEVRVTIAGQACLLILEIPEEYFDRLQTILVYPYTYYAKDTTVGPGGLVLEGIAPRLGEAWHRGPVVLSWPSVLRGCRIPDDGDNVVLHEFAHQLDMEDQFIDGTPPLETEEQYRTWQEVMTVEYEQLVRSSQRRRATLLDDYGATNEAEFFAVATECFFELPVEMARQHPRLYEVLQFFYRQDPADRVARSKEF